MACHLPSTKTPVMLDCCIYIYIPIHGSILMDIDGKCSITINKKPTSYVSINLPLTYMDPMGMDQTCFFRIRMGKRTPATSIVFAIDFPRPANQLWRI